MPALGATDPADLAARARAELGFSRLLKQPRLVTTPPCFGVGGYPVWYCNQQMLVAGGSPSHTKRSRGRSRAGGGGGNEIRSPHASPSSNSSKGRRSRSEARHPNSPTLVSKKKTYQRNLPSTIARGYVISTPAACQRRWNATLSHYVWDLRSWRTNRTWYNVDIGIREGGAAYCGLPLSKMARYLRLHWHCR